jgi:hypothetical protein
MATVVVSAHFHTREEEFATAVEALLRDMGAKVDKIQNLHGTIAILGTDMTPKGMDAPLPLPLPIPAPTDAVEVDLPSVEDTEMTVAIAPSDTIAMSEPPPPVAPISSTGEVVLKNLSSVCAVPFCVDTSVPTSSLKVQGLSKIGDVLTFNYCSMSFKMPAEPPAGNPVRNTNPQYTDHSIRTMVDIVGKNADLIPVLLQLVDGPESCVVFGADLADVVGNGSADSLEKNSDGSLPTQ